MLRDKLTPLTDETLRAARVISFSRRLDRKYYFCLDVTRSESRDYIFRTYQVRTIAGRTCGPAALTASQRTALAADDPTLGCGDRWA